VAFLEALHTQYRRDGDDEPSTPADADLSKIRFVQSARITTVSHRIVKPTVRLVNRCWCLEQVDSPIQARHATPNQSVMRAVRYDGVIL
jgi:hypothetical protein